MHGMCRRWKRILIPLAVLFVGIFPLNVDGTLTYLGCFREQTCEDRLFKGDQRVFTEHLSPQICASHCEQKSFRFFGLQYSNECFCSSTRPTFQSSAYENECNMQCVGNVHDKCGGSLRLSVYETDNAVSGVTTLSASSPRYVGCYKEISSATRLLPEANKNFPGELTVDKCVSFCLEKNFDYAGVQYGSECFCSKTRPSFKSSADDKDCDKPCDGDKQQLCGGGWRLGVYETTEQARNPVSSNYIGCFFDNQENRLLQSAFKDLVGLLTPETCVSFCYRGGYRYAGVQQKFGCFCGSKVLSADQRVQETDCDAPCPGDGSILCGGNDRTSVYHTEIPDYPEDDRLLGCFKDNDHTRTLSGEKIVFTENNTPRLCMNVCLGLGYKYAGVQYGSECFCGIKRPSQDLEVSERDCLMPCPGDKWKKCGGGWRLLIYKVPDIKESHKPSTKPIVVATTTTTQRTTTTRRTPRPTSRPTKTTPLPSRPVLLQNNENNCVRSETEINGKNACKGALIFSDNFNRGITEKWAHEIMMPSLPDYEFIVLQKNRSNSYVENDKLHIKPTVQEDAFIRHGKLELYGCTGVPYSDECTRQAIAYSILPPIESAKITTKDTFTFKYGIIQIRAKLPQGDWIIPEISLEPKRKVYGPSYASGKLRIAMARGNKNLMYKGEDIGNRRLESGVLMGVGENIWGRTILRDMPDGWYRKFHNFTVIWTKDDISFLVDGQQKENLMVPDSTLAELVGFDQKSLAVWRTGSRIAPFDQEFYISLGLSVGGMRDFPDNSTSSGHSKPWNNLVVKAMANFWEDRYNWQNTWDRDNAQLQIEHVKVYAL